MSKDVSCGHGNKKGQITGLHQEKKTIKVVTEIAGTGLRTVELISKSWKDSSELSA